MAIEWVLTCESVTRGHQKLLISTDNIWPNVYDNDNKKRNMVIKNITIRDQNNSVMSNLRYDAPSSVWHPALTVCCGATGYELCMFDSGVTITVCGFGILLFKHLPSPVTVTVWSW